MALTKYFTKYVLHLFKTFVFLLLTTQMMIDAALAQDCSNSSLHKLPEPSLEAYAPTQRVGDILTVSRDRQLSSQLPNQLVWSLPTEFTEIEPFTGQMHQLANHEGLDFINTDPSVDQVIVRSAADGIVVYTRRNCPQSQAFGENLAQRDCGGDWGNHIVIRHTNGLFTRYAHLFPDSIVVLVEQRVRLGQEMGKMGNSGRSDTRHLHFELGVAINVNPCASAQSFNYVYDPIILFCNSAIASFSSPNCDRLKSHGSQ
jgi:murein DD-endopeptidase MepM/ murein hydrolase activator NlpD